MSKRNVAFIKPEEPAFLKRMKEQIGYKEADTIDAKRGPIQNLDSDDDEFEEKDDEKPQVIQLRKGDLTEEEAKKFAKEEAEKPADLSQRIIFKVKKKKDEDNSEGSKTDDKPQKSKKSKEKPAKNLLSFNDDDDGE